MLQKILSHQEFAKKANIPFQKTSSLVLKKFFVKKTHQILSNSSVKYQNPRLLDHQKIFSRKFSDENKKENKFKPVPLGIPGVEHIIAVSSAKGGVGKSTVAVNLALAFSKMNKKVGILDSDMYGPSIPKLMGTEGSSIMQNSEQKILPIPAYNIQTISIGNLIDPKQALIWRGPLVTGTLNQLFRDVEWGELDILVLDLPPGTGDTQLTISQSLQLSGAVIVSTPQDIALNDAIRGVVMFQKVNVPVIGIVENMSYYECPKCHHVENIFGSGGAKKMSEDMKIDLLGQIPLHTDIRKFSDEGTPIVEKEPNSSYSKKFMEIANKIIKKLDEKKLSKEIEPPKITMK
ncbi:iron-sulfur protein nubpl [Anaeramoeba ignava]|uniref:Iron-sulfur protein nubpl n=1 Tax=Anaeramoeba ignava TaxID=1746090 RepID=A0A9Q0LFM2_ANAIG|nr:iron-sulfur protein nubpl [Anaeramoeba ignava]